jgi:D-alanyl-D-alanine carboxypeptidase
MKRLGFIYLCLFAFAVQAQDFQKRVQHKLDSLQKQNGFPGVTLCAILPNNEKIIVASGWADSLSKTPMGTESRMLSGSNGKTLFIAAALKLASEGVFSLDDKISKYLGDESWFNRLPNAQSVTMRMLMNHTSGIEEYYTLGNFMELVKVNPERTFEPYDTFKYIFDRKPLFEAGSQWGYSDTNFIILGYILEKISGKLMYEWVKEVVIQPYGLSKTEPSIQMSFKNLATGYSRANSPFPFQGAMVKEGKLVFNPQFEWMGGGFVSHVQDIRAEMKKKVPARTGKNHGYGLGIQIRPSATLGESYGHSGWFPGYLTDAAYFPDKNISVAIQLNTDDISKIKSSPYDLLQLIANILL